MARASIGFGLALGLLSFAGGCQPEAQTREQTALAGSCEGYCGGEAPSGCFCDAECAASGDCCSDAELVCQTVAANCDDAWIGSPCASDEACGFDADGVAGTCMKFEDGEGSPYGFCSVPCAGGCPDQDGHATTFCVSIEGEGQCVAQADNTFNSNCESIPGTKAKVRSRYVGASGASSSSASVCVPDTSTVATGDILTDLVALTEDCERLDGTQLFRTDAGRARTIEMCQLDGAIWWRADGDIDCDGGRSEPCTSDPWYQPETSSKDSTGQFIDSATVPHFVVPLDGSGFVKSEHGIKTNWSGIGSAGIIIYDGQMIYAPYADAGPRHILGELSAAAAAELGIPNHPVSGGVAEGVTYIVFTGENYVSPIESREAAEALGEELALRLIENN